ncbi:uncharacterized protein [Haliotis asinina]|uniref:uncharacterized protein n=1 Tax=Haliotis asinina TaxID=109174 RepID=UPI003531DE1E
MTMLLALVLVVGVARCAIVTNCSDFSPAICQPDFISYCFTDGTTAQGSCAANQKICFENGTLTGDDSCFSMTSSTPSSTTEQDNGGTFLSPQLVPAVLMLLVFLLGLTV